MVNYRLISLALAHINNFLVRTGLRGGVSEL